MKTWSNELWHGRSKLIIGVDLGSTHSGVSYAYLFDGGGQLVTRVSEWPGQEAHKTDSKIPTLIWYDRHGNPKAFGAEALSPDVMDTALDEDWQLAKHFKLHLHPNTLIAKHRLKLDSLPRGVELSKIYSDFLSYLLGHTISAFRSRIVDGARIWDQLSSTGAVEFVLAHPNGWGLSQQAFLREAAIQAGYVEDDAQAALRIRFVSEGEASVHFCMFNANLGPLLNTGVKIVVCDAGGSTVDTTSYIVKSGYPNLELEEAKASDCIQAGGIFVDAMFESFLREHLEKPGPSGKSSLTTEDVEDFLKRGLSDFEGTTKRAFSGAQQSKYFIDLGAGRYTDEKKGIRRGRMVIDGELLRRFFDPFVSQIVEAVEDQMSGLVTEHVLLVGGFGESPYLRDVLRQRFEGGRGRCKVMTANDATAKAVSDGAVIYHATQTVKARACRFQYGLVGGIPYDESLPEHGSRDWVVGRDGVKWMSNKWYPMVERGDVITAGDGISENMYNVYHTPHPALGTFSERIYAFTLPNEEGPYWAMDPDGKPEYGMECVCEITANLSNLRGGLVEKVSPSGNYWILDYNVVIEFGGTELHAYLEWTENGETKRGKASLIPGSFM